MVLLRMLLALVLTVTVECGAAALVLRSRTIVWVVCLCNLLTNPALNLLLIASVKLFGLMTYAPVLVVLELLVVAVEAHVLSRATPLSGRSAWLASLALNALSFVSGLVLDRLAWL